MSWWPASVRYATGAGYPRRLFQGVVLGQQRLGVNLVSLMVTLREEGRLPLVVH